MIGQTVGRGRLELPLLNFKQVGTMEKVALQNELRTREGGLSESEASERHLQGANEVLAKQTTWQEVLIRQFKSSFIYLLFAAFAVSLFMGEVSDAILILFFLIINAVLGFYQEFRAEHSLQLLKQFVERRTRVFRDGKEVTIAVREVVVGDVVLLDAGDMIPADGYFLSAEQVSVDESPMTGETKPVAKVAIVLEKKPENFYDAKNIGFSRTTLVSGDARLLIFAIGNKTEVGSIVKQMESANTESTFEIGISRFSTFILKMVLATIPLIFVLNLIIHHEVVHFGEFLLFAIALTVSVIPEALPLVMTLSLSRGAIQMAKKHVVPRRLSAIEDLGSIDILCSDKTGTITENKLSVHDVFGEREAVMRYAGYAALSRPDSTSSQNSVFDNAVIAFHEAKMTKHELSFVDEMPFDPIRKRSTVLVRVEGKLLLVSRGAPELLISRTTPKGKEAIEWAKEEGGKGCRVLAVNIKEVAGLDKRKITTADEKGMTFVGLVSFADPLKKSTKGAIHDAGKLGVQVKIITGDGKEVAGWVGYEAGLITDRSQVITGDELEKLSPEEKILAVEKYHVFARTMPLQKYAIIELLQKSHLVGFLGEGFNDAPALKMAHVGLAVANASDIAQDAADVILLNPSLHVIIDGIREGRKIFANSIKYIRATLASNFGNFYALALSSLFIPYLPMLSVQILLLNLLSDFPMISIATDTVDDAELKRPRGYQVKEITMVAIVLGVVSTIFDFSFFGYFVQYGEETLQTMWFVGSVLTELVLLFSIRTMLPFWRSRAPSKTIIYLTVCVVALTIAIPYTTLGQEFFKFVVPEPKLLLAALGLVALYFISTEAVKLFFYRFWNEKSSQHAGL